MFCRFRRFLTALAIGDVLLTMAALALAVVARRLLPWGRVGRRACWRPGFSAPRLSRRAWPRGLNGALALTVIGAAGLKAAMVWRKPAVETAVRDLGFPVDAATWIAEEDPPGELYNPYDWGGYLIWRLLPDHQVFVDGRADMYGDPFLLEYVDLTSAAPEWENILASHDVCTALVKADGPLSGAMARSPDWNRGYADEASAIYLRTSELCAPAGMSGSAPILVPTDRATDATIASSHPTQGLGRGELGPPLWILPASLASADTREALDSDHPAGPRSTDSNVGRPLFAHHGWPLLGAESWRRGGDTEGDR